MEAHNAPELLHYLHDALIVLVVIGLVVPWLSHTRVNAVLGFLVAGLALGPHGLGRFAQQQPWLGWVTFGADGGVRIIGELGVVLLLFTIGLELSFRRLWTMRRWVLGAGSLQVGLTAVAIGVVAWLWGNSVQSSAVLGLALALSSTAVVMQLLVERHEAGTAVGRASFSVLLMQDLAVVPLIILVTVLSLRSSGTDGGLGAAVLWQLGLGLAFILAVALGGRWAVRRAFSLVIATRRHESFIALALLVVIGTSAVSAALGLSMALGAFLAGMVVAETEYRHEVEVNLLPLRGLTMGLFFMGVGMSIDLAEVAAMPVMVLVSVLGLFALKAAIITPLFMAFGLRIGEALRCGLLLGQGGEFAFIALALAVQGALVTSAVGQFMLIVASVSLLITPGMAALGVWLQKRLAPPELPPHQAVPGALPGLVDHVVIAGFGRVGRRVAQTLEAQALPYIAFDRRAAVVEPQHAQGHPVHFGDASRRELLMGANVHKALAFIVTMDEPEAALQAVRAVREFDARLPIFARARDERHGRALLEAGATAVVPEALEASLQLAGMVMEKLGVSEESRLAVLERERQLCRLSQPGA